MKGRMSVKRYTGYFVLCMFCVLMHSCINNEPDSDAYGNFEAREVMVSAEVQGRILELNIEEGQQPDSGEVVAFIDTTDFSLKRDQLISGKRAVLSRLDYIEAQIEVQQQQIENLLVDKQRLENLFKDGAATSKQLEDIGGVIKLAEKQIRVLETQKQSVFDEAKTIDVQIMQVAESISKCYIRNPIQGTVLNRFKEPFELVTPGVPIYKIATLSKMELKVYVSGAMLPGIKIGQKVQVLVDRDKTTNQVFEGEISWISDQAGFTPKIIQTKDERVNLVYAVKISVKNDGTLKIGMPGEANF